MKITDLLDDYYDDSVKLPECSAPYDRAVVERTKKKLGITCKKRRHNAIIGGTGEAAADGNPDTPPLFRAQKGLSEDHALSFQLKAAQVMDGGTVWLRYTVE